MVEYWGHLLKHEGPKTLKEHLQKEKTTNENQKAAKKVLERYLKDNEYRMQYPTYILQGYMIGSGAIEFAHKTVIQRRMKLSGQRWSLKGAKNMLNLRCVALSGHWDWGRTTL